MVSGVVERSTLLGLPSSTNTGRDQCRRHREHSWDLDASLVQAYRAALAHAHDGRGAAAADIGKGAEVVTHLVDGLVILLRPGRSSREGVGILHQVEMNECVSERVVGDCSNESANGDRQETKRNRNAPVTA